MTKKNLKDRLLSKVNNTNSNECWEWTAKTAVAGYGRLTVDKKSILAHRLSYELFKGKIPEDFCVCHTCDNRKCINPDHLWLGTKSDNTKDMYSKNRQYDVAGENHGRTKLNWSQIGEIRKLKGKETLVNIGKKYGIAKSAVSAIQRGITWNRKERKNP